MPHWSQLHRQLQSRLESTADTATSYAADTLRRQSPQLAIAQDEAEQRRPNVVLPFLCATCKDIPVEIFRPSYYGLAEDGQVQVTDNTPKRDCCYQHFNSVEDLQHVISGFGQNCPLCTILWLSLEASRQSLPRSRARMPQIPARLPTEIGITLHSFDHDHFIVRDDTRWSLVRFSEGSRVNEKG